MVAARVVTGGGVTHPWCRRGLWGLGARCSKPVGAMVGTEREGGDRVFGVKKRMTREKSCG
jgi:hypothetical protein